MNSFDVFFTKGFTVFQNNTLVSKSSCFFQFNWLLMDPTLNHFYSKLCFSFSYTILFARSLYSNISRFMVGNFYNCSFSYRGTYKQWDFIDDLKLFNFNNMKVEMNRKFCNGVLNDLARKKKHIQLYWTVWIKENIYSCIGQYE